MTRALATEFQHHLILSLKEHTVQLNSTIPKESKHLDSHASPIRSRSTHFTAQVSCAIPPISLQETAHLAQSSLRIRSAHQFRKLPYDRHSFKVPAVLSWVQSAQQNPICFSKQDDSLYDCHSCRAPAVLTHGIRQLRRSARPRVPGVGTWRPSQGSRGCWPLRQPSPSSASHRRTQTSGPEQPHGTHASCKDADLHGGSGLAALRRCGISQLCCKYTALLF